MKKLFHIFILNACSLLLHSQVNLQLAINPLTANPPFRVSYGDSLVYALSVVNNDSVSFAGNVYVGFKGSNSSGSDSIDLGILQIAPNSVLQRVITIKVQPQYFKTGPEVVVVWPIFDGQNGNEIADFIFVRNDVNNVSAISESTINYFISGNLLKCSECSIPIKQVRIFDLTGKSIFASNTGELPLSLEVVQNGVYVVEVENTYGSFSTLKWLKY